MLQHLFLGWFTSFLGSLPVGIISLMIVDLSANRGLRQGLAAAWGASLVEGVQTFLALSLLGLFMQLPWLDSAFRLLALPIFGMLAWQHLRSSGQVRRRELGHIRSGFRKGVVITALNVLIFPYFFIVGTALAQENKLPQNNFDLSIFSIGACFGTMAAMGSYALLGRSLQKQLPKYNYIITKVIGLVFLGVCFIQVYYLWSWLDTHYLS